MDEERYTNRQIERLLDQQTENLKSHIDMATRPILEQTTKTNGRVTTLEKKSDKLEVRTTNIDRYIWFAILMFVGGWGLFLALVSSGHLTNIKF